MKETKIALGTWAWGTVIPFITSGSTGISSAASELKSTYPDINWKTGDRLNDKTSAQLKSWLESLGIKVKQK